ncbi:SGNH/GDSL hydrolase family protein [Pseudarthrobacter sp. J1738]|uniref:SGNH/GDSL hydrolase family protein n=1 Tax=Pseudarthrobacter sp. J1738 TaxID=3420446 RepID=UPI003D2B75B3
MAKSVAHTRFRVLTLTGVLLLAVCAQPIIQNVNDGVTSPRISSGAFSHAGTMRQPTGSAGSGPIAAGGATQVNAAGSNSGNQGNYPASNIIAAGLADGTLVRNPRNDRIERVVPDISRTALLIGDSQAAGAAGVPGERTWPRQGLNRVGYKVYFVGGGGTGYMAANSTTGNYYDALQHGDWYLPSSAPQLVVFEGGGNDAARGYNNEEIVANADKLVASLQVRYPTSKFLMLGTLARSQNDGGGRRHEVDTVLASVAKKHGIPFVSAGNWITQYNLGSDLADRVHMKMTGHNKLATIFSNKLKAINLQAR